MNTSPRDTEVWVSYLQIYCEEIEDLLVISNNNLNIREKSSRVFVEGLSRVRVLCMEDFWNVLESGDKRRSTAATSVNSISSRSHAIMIVTLRSPDVTQPSTERGNSQDPMADTMRESSLYLVDLAGSERSVNILYKNKSNFN